MTLSLFSPLGLILMLPLGPSVPLEVALVVPVESASMAEELGLPMVRELGSDWIASSSDHICGLSSLRALSDPAKVDYSDLWEATPEIKRLKNEGIDPDSAEGIQLQQAAKDRILDACKTVQSDEGHCSVWKKIEHEDGRTIPDITEKVQAKFPE